MSLVFVTVGTTRFDALIHCICDPKILSELSYYGYDRVIMQVGHSHVEDIDFDALANSMPRVEFYRFKPSLHEDMVKADLIVSHAGAGCLFESLRLKKPCIAVINEDLMGNHQMELAGELHRNRHILMTTVRQILSLLRDHETFRSALKGLVEMEPPKTSAFAHVVDQEMGFFRTE